MIDRQLPDSCFAFVSRDKGKRLFPHHDATGKLDIPHLGSAVFYVGLRLMNDDFNSLRQHREVILHLLYHTRQCGLSEWTRYLEDALLKIERSAIIYSNSE